MSKISQADIDVLFNGARTFFTWTDEKVSDGVLKQVYDLAKMAPKPVKRFMEQAVWRKWRRRPRTVSRPESFLSFPKKPRKNWNRVWIPAMSKKR